MILPLGHAQQIRRAPRFRRRERVMIAGVLAIVAVLAVVLVISLGTADKKSANGCISVSLPYSTGGNHIYECGAGARSMCHGVNRPGLTGSAGRMVARACRQAGLRVG